MAVTRQVKQPELGRFEPDALEGTVLKRRPRLVVVTRLQPPPTRAWYLRGRYACIVQGLLCKVRYCLTIHRDLSQSGFPYSCLTSIMTSSRVFGTLADV